MVDILLDKQGDIIVDNTGDIRLEESIQQKVLIRLKWFFREWRWNRAEGLPYWERLFKKGPETDLFLMAMRDRIMMIDEITKVENLSARISAQRECRITYAVRTTRDMIIREEVIFSV